MNKTMKKLALFLALTMGVGAISLAGADGDLWAQPTMTEEEQTEVGWAETDETVITTTESEPFDADGNGLDASDGSVVTNPQSADENGLWEGGNIGEYDTPDDDEGQGDGVTNGEEGGDGQTYEPENDGATDEGDVSGLADEPTVTFSVRIETDRNDGEPIYFGDTVTLTAVIEDTDVEVNAIAWQLFDKEATEQSEDETEVWNHAASGAELVVNVPTEVQEESASWTYRVMVNGVVSSKYTLTAQAKVEEQGEQTDPSEEEEENTGSTEDGQTEQGEEKEPVQEEPELDSGLTITASSQTETEGKLRIGDTVTLSVDLSRYAKVVSVQWQMSDDAEAWQDVPGATGDEYKFEITKDNYNYSWRVVVTVEESET